MSFMINNKEPGIFDTVKNGIQSKIFEPINQKAQGIVDQTQNYQLGFIVLLTGLGLFSLSFLFLPLIIISPYKFCTLNSLGTFTMFSSVVIMRGFKVFKRLVQKDKIFFTLIFLLGLLLEFYFSVFRPFYPMVLLSTGMNFIGTMYLTLSFVPYGVQVMNQIMAFFGRGFKFIFGRAMKKEKKSILPF